MKKIYFNKSLIGFSIFLSYNRTVKELCSQIKKTVNCLLYTSTFVHASVTADLEGGRGDSLGTVPEDFA